LSLLTIVDVFDELGKGLHSLIARVIPDHSRETPLVADHAPKILDDTACKLFHFECAAGSCNRRVALLRQLRCRPDAL